MSFVELGDRTNVHVTPPLLQEGGRFGRRHALGHGGVGSSTHLAGRCIIPGPMTSPTPHVRVVAAVIERDGKYLITQRRSTAVLPGLWEFPGGKVEPGESDEHALRRELRERVGVDVEVKGRMAHRLHRYDGYAV